MGAAVGDTAITLEEEKRVQLPSDTWSDDFAKRVSMRDFGMAESYRRNSHDWRFTSADELYLAWVQQKYWEGTKVPRSSLGVFVAFEQVESILPKMVASVFSDNPWFDCAPRPGSSPEEARSVTDLLTWQMEEARAKEAFRRAWKSKFIYGNGIVETGWKTSQVERRRFVQEFIPKFRTVNLPGMPPIKLPTGEHKRRVKEEKYKEDLNMPFVEYRSIKDCYADPNCQSPNIQDGRFFIHRAYKFADELKALRGQFGFNIPPDAELAELAKNKTSAQGDFTKSASESYRAAQWQPQIDSSADPSAKRVEVIAYWTKDRLVWVANREKILFNQANPYGFIPFFNTTYADVLDRFYGLGVCDVVEGDQRLIQSIINARVDELSLSLHPTRIKRRGLSVPAYQLRRRPGQLIEAEDPEKDIVTEQVQNITENAYVEVEAAERRVQKSTGVTDLAVLGAPSSGGNSASRTATGVNVQAQASGGRLQYQVFVDEENFVEPVLNAIHSLNIRFLSPDQIQTVLGPEGQQVKLDPLDVKNADVKFQVRASAKMASKIALQQSLPMLMQSLLNPELMTAIAQQQNKVIDAVEFCNMILDATGYQYKRHAIVRDMTPQELQAMQQQQQMENGQQAEMMKAQTDAQVQQQKVQLQAQTSQQKMQLEEQKMHQKMQLEKEKHHSELQIQQMAGHQKVAVEGQKAQTQQQLDIMKTLAQIDREKATIDKSTEKGNQ